MKRLFFLGVSLVSTAFLLFAIPTACHADGKPIRVEELPIEAREMLNTYFNNDPVQFALYDREWDDWGYEVRLQSGAEIDFTRNGIWVYIDCAPHAVPDDLIPTQILQEVKRNHPNNRIVQIERNRRSYALKLSGDFELKYAPDGTLIGYDD